MTMCVRLVFIGLIFFGLMACSSQPGLEMHSSAMGKAMPYDVYTPPGWTPDERLPLVLLLHGARGSHASFDQYDVDLYFDELERNGILPRAVVLLPYGGLGFWENWRDDKRQYRNWVLENLMPHVQEKFNTLPCPEFCHVSGVSMGGHGALRFAYFAPETFSSVSAISAIFLAERDQKEMTLPYRIALSFLPREKVWGENYKSPSSGLDQHHNWTKDPKLDDIRLFVTWGAEESTSIAIPNVNFTNHLEDHNRRFSYEIFNGNHNWHDWKYAIAQSVRFHIWGESAEIITLNGEWDETASVD